MEPGKIHGATREFGKPENWDDDTMGSCATLPILDIQTEAGAAMISEWLPSDEERAAIAAGMPVHVWIYGTVHPVLSVTVGQERNE